MGFDLDRGGGDVGSGRLDHVGIEGALGQEVDASEAGRLSLEDRDELSAHDPPLLFRVEYPAKLLQKAIGRIDVANVHVEVAVHNRKNTLGLLLAEQSVVHKDTGELVADRTMNQGRGHRRVHATRQGADDTTVSDLRANALCRFGDERSRRP